VGPESLVGLHVERSPDILIGILGILKAGGAYVPLDPAYPADRLRFMIEDSGVRVVVTQSALSLGAIVDESGPQLIALDRDAVLIDRQDAENPGHKDAVPEN